MTEQEAEGLAARLRRIWNPKQVSWRGRSYIQDKVFTFGGEISPGVNFGFSIREGEAPYVAMGWNKCELECFCGKIQSHYAEGVIVEPEQWNVLLPRFTNQWVDTFRRNCWLSGCAIEASAHEKAEWMQGFSREELQAWNLKM